VLAGAEGSRTAVYINYGQQQQQQQKQQLAGASLGYQLMLWCVAACRWLCCRACRLLCVFCQMYILEMIQDELLVCGICVGRSWAHVCHVHWEGWFFVTALVYQAGCALCCHKQRELCQAAPQFVPVTLATGTSDSGVIAGCAASPAGAPVTTAVTFPPVVTAPGAAACARAFSAASAPAAAALACPRATSVVVAWGPSLLT
jgi:hypothetical protein